MARCIYDVLKQERSVSLKSRLKEGGRLLKKPPASAYEAASDLLARDHQIPLGVESIAKIYQRLRPEFVGDRDLIDGAADALRLLRKMRDGNFVGDADEPHSPGDPERPTDASLFGSIKIGN
ncbi:MAG: hypothetical protein C0521_05425 [Xanthomonas sp.]|nr:hypothetical protein [Xanthomonas sp.]